MNQFSAVAYLQNDKNHLRPHTYLCAFWVIFRLPFDTVTGFYFVTSYEITAILNTNDVKRRSRVLRHVLRHFNRALFYTAGM